jgi:galactonate dehydratase
LEQSTIVAVETLTSRAYPQLLHIQVEAADGTTGLGETFHRSEAVAAYIHAVAAHVVLGQDGLNAVRLRRLLGSRFDGGSVPGGVATIDSSAISAFDIALWDLRGKYFGAGICDLLGGKLRDAVPVYNTCAGPGEGMPVRNEDAERWGLGGERGLYDDYTAMWERPAELASELIDENIRAMKLYTFRRFAQATLGNYITPAQIEEAIAPVRAIRDAVGMSIDLMMDLVFDWTLPAAQKIVAALEEFDLLWIEDPLRWGSRRHHRVLQGMTKTPLAAFDYGVGLESYLNLIEAGGLSLLRIDPQWCGGVTEAAAIASVAGSVGLGVVFHDCTGPVAFAASTHLAANAPTPMLQESVRGYWRRVYPQIVTACPAFEDGAALPPLGPGLGLALSDSYLALPDLQRTRSTLVNGSVQTRSA